MIDDPIVAAVRKVRDEPARAYNYDVHAMFADMRRRQEALGERLVRQPLKPAAVSTLTSVPGTRTDFEKD